MVSSIGFKGGIGKSAAARELAAILNPDKKISVLELDSFNKSKSLVENSEIVTITTFKAFGETLDDAMDEALMLDAQEGNLVVFDLGAGHDTHTALKKIGFEYEGEVEYFVPIMPDPETVTNVEDVLAMIPKNAKKILILNNFVNVPYDYWFITGSEKYGFEPDYSVIEKFDEVIEFPRTNLISIMKAYRTTMSDVAKFSQQYDIVEQRKKWALELDRDELKAMMKRHRLSVDCNKFIEGVRASRLPSKKWITKMQAAMEPTND